MSVKPQGPEGIAAHGRELEASRWELPAKFRLDEKALALPRSELKKQYPEMAAVIELSEAKQKEWAVAAAMPFGQMSPQDAERARSVTIAENLRFTLENIKKRIGAAAISGEGDLDELQNVQKALLHELAQRHAIIGRYDLAAQEDPDPQYREHYGRILDAVWRDDSDWCDCPDQHGSGEQANLSTSRQFVKEEILSLKTGTVVFLLACSECGMLNAVPVLPRHITIARGHRSRAQTLVGHLSPNEAEETLRSRGHTSQNLFKK